MQTDAGSHTGRVHVRGVDLAYEAAGVGQPFVWAHGMTNSRAFEMRYGDFDWSGLRDVARVVRYDARGHGESAWTPRPEDYTWGSLAADMLALADASGLDRFDAGGASMGCATALYAALAAPARIRRLVLATPPTSWDTRAARASFLAAGAELAEQHGIEAVADSEAAAPLPGIFARDMPERKALDREATLALDPQAFVALLRGAALTDLPPHHRIREIAQPALILAWDTDPAHPSATAEQLDELLPDSRLHVATDLAQIRAWPGIVRAFLLSTKSGPV